MAKKGQGQRLVNHLQKNPIIHSSCRTAQTNDRFITFITVTIVLSGKDNSGSTG
jgi:hypothetical protein